jgi:hypothetical protein
MIWFACHKASFDPREPITSTYFPLLPFPSTEPEDAPDGVEHRHSARVSRVLPHLRDSAVRDLIDDAASERFQSLFLLGSQRA